MDSHVINTRLESVSNLKAARVKIAYTRFNFQN